MASAHTFNPRYVNYARAYGRTPDEQLEHDRGAWPGGLMAGFIIWMRERHGEAGKAIPQAYMADGLTDHAMFDAWLDARVDELTPA